MRVHQPGEQERDAEGNNWSDEPDNEELVDLGLTKDVFGPQFGHPNTQNGAYVELDQRGGHAFDHGGQEEQTGGDKGNDDRSEERRVGKEGRARWGAGEEKKRER